MGKDSEIDEFRNKIEAVAREVNGFVDVIIEMINAVIDGVKGLADVSKYVIIAIPIYLVSQILIQVIKSLKR